MSVKGTSTANTNSEVGETRVGQGAETSQKDAHPIKVVAENPVLHVEDCLYKRTPAQYGPSGKGY